MGDKGLCKHNQMGYCKFRDKCNKIHENDICEKQACNPSKCRKRHPKLCKHFSQRLVCRYGKDCGYKHQETDGNIKPEQFNALNEDIKNLKAEVDVLKNTIKTLSSIKQEGNLIKKSVEKLKEEIKKIKAENCNIIKKLTYIEKEFEDEHDEESDNESVEESEQDLFQIEMVNNEMVWACNLCDEGFDSSEELNKHMLQEHQKVINIKDNTMEERHCHREDIPKHDTNSEDEEVLTKEDYPQITCKLCDEGFDGNSEIKEHFIKEHMNDEN